MKNSSPSVTYLFFKYFFAVTLLTGSFSLSSIEKSSEVIDISDEIYQGALVVGRVKPGFEVFHAGRNIKLDDSDQIIFGVGRDASETIDLTIRNKSGKKRIVQLKVNKRHYDIQYVEGVPQRTVDPSEEDLARIRTDSKLVREARKNMFFEPFFLEGFSKPIEGPKTGVYGSQRFYNGVAGRPHFGIDYAASEGSQVLAPASGIVTLSEDDLFYSGGTIILDHGYGVSSSFLHLSEIVVKVGQRVKHGDVIGLVGSTGRSTGPHLDWRMNWFDVRIDPELVLRVLPNNQ